MKNQPRMNGVIVTDSVTAFLKMKDNLSLSHYPGVNLYRINQADYTVASIALRIEIADKYTHNYLGTQP